MVENIAICGIMDFSAAAYSNLELSTLTHLSAYFDVDELI